MDKFTARARDIAWKEAQNVREKVGLAKLSHFLVGLNELRKMWLSLQHDECLVLSANGSIHKGARVDANLAKMHKLQEEYRTEEKSDILRVASDLRTAEEMYPMPVTSRRSTWDYRTRLAGDSSKGGGKKGRKAEPVLPADEI